MLRRIQALTHGNRPLTHGKQSRLVTFLAYGETSSAVGFGPGFYANTRGPPESPGNNAGAPSPYPCQWRFTTTEGSEPGQSLLSVACSLVNVAHSGGRERKESKTSSTEFMENGRSHTKLQNFASFVVFSYGYGPAKSSAARSNTEDCNRVSDYALGLFQVEVSLFRPNKKREW